MSNFYHNKYFNSSIFEYDYKPIADAIMKSYHPKRVIEFGCGNGQLCKELAAHGVEILALDGYASPDFTSFPSIQFYPLDLNDQFAVKQFLADTDKTFDLAISLEVAEHLQPEVSSSLIASMTSVANVVVFSAAVPRQSGDGHINCRSHLEWYRYFKENNFVISDTIRGQFRNHPHVGMWYKINTVDYVKGSSFKNEGQFDEQLVERLIEAETFAASLSFHYTHQTELRDWALHLQPIKTVVKLRNFLTRALGKKSIEI